MTNSFTVSCKNCGLNELCLPHSLNETEMDILDAQVERKKPLQKGETLFSQGDRFHSLYAVRSGSVKTYTIDSNGEEQVIGFHLPGELIGLDAIGTESFQNSAKALETSSFCEIPYDKMTQLSQKIGNLQRHMYQLLGREIRQDQELQLLLGKKTAEERIAAFLFNLAERYRARKLSATVFRLPMVRTDIANYLGLAVETTSRIFTRLQQQEIISVRGKEVQVLNQHALCELAHCEATIS